MIYAATGIPAVRAVGDALRKLDAAFQEQGLDSSDEDLDAFMRSARELARILVSIMKQYRKLLS